eukprot:scaffold152_cov52-Cyclotella_meneghiniana.AAC.4
MSHASITAEIASMSAKAAQTMTIVGERAAKAHDSLEERVSILESGVSSTVPPLSAGTVPPQGSVPGALGSVNGESITLEFLLQKILDIESENASLRKEVTSLKTAASTSGVKVGEYAFEDLSEIVSMIQDEGDLDLESFATCLDAVSYFAHYASGEASTAKTTDEISAMKKAGITDPTCCAYVASFRMIHPSFLLGSLSKLDVGSRFALLQNKSAWEGQISIEGAQGSLKKAIKSVRTTAKEYIANTLPKSSSALRALALDLVTRTHEWWTELITYIDDELLTLTQFGISEEKVYTFICDELQCIFRRIFEQRIKMQVISSTRDPTLYYARCVWFTLHAHMIMDEFKEAKFGTHTEISALFTRFLAEQTGSDHGSNLAGQIKSLGEEIKKVNSALNSKSTAINGRLDKMDVRREGEAPAITERSTVVIAGELSALTLPGDLVLIAQGWSGAVAAALQLSLPIRCAYLDPSALPFYGSMLFSSSLVVVRDISTLSDAVFAPSSVLVIHCSADFFAKLRRWGLRQNQRLCMWIVSVPQVERSFKTVTHSLNAVEKLCIQYGFKPFLFKHADYGGATTARHIIGFSSGFHLGGDGFPHPPNVDRTLRHFWKSAAKLQHPTRLDSEPPAVVGDHKRPLKYKDSLRLEGLFSVSDPHAVVCGPTVFFKNKYVHRKLSQAERMALYDVPSELMSVFSSAGNWASNSSLPFDHSILPVDLQPSETVSSESEPSSEPSSVAPSDISSICTETVLSESEPSSEPSSVAPSDISSICTEASKDSTIPPLVAAADDRSFDASSAEDSFMPRRKENKRTASIDCNDCWEFLDDVSVAPTATETDESTGASIISYGEELSQHDFSLGSVSSGPSSLSSTTTIASEVTCVTSASRPTLDSVAEATIGKKAVKADDSKVPTFLWNSRIDGKSTDQSLSGFRVMGLQLFRRALYLDCMEYIEAEYGSGWREALALGHLYERHPNGKLTQLGKELEAVRNILWHANETNWFEYLSGSRLHHFRFPIRYRNEARDGTRIYFEKAGPTTKQNQPAVPPEILDQVTSKIKKVIKRRYMTRGERDIRMVYDATASGLNGAVWAPSFWLPTVNSLVRSLDSNSWMTDRDIGDMFLNFPLHEEARPFTGVDIKPILTGQDAKKFRWYQWVRNAMGFAPSPYNSIKMALIAEEVIRGDRMDRSNPFHWEEIRLNMPGTENYDPTKSWIMKLRAEGMSACEFFTFVDDERIKGPTEELTWRAAQFRGRCHS